MVLGIHDLKISKFGFRGVRIVHKPSGLVVGIDSSNSFRQNRIIALRRLQNLLTTKIRQKELSRV